ncbi:hypothetical protein [uncultured Ruegeria sp.]|uniref:hypothetical protein n=1 Tax=uncultured Ruegeria sp. TaxID=259304 RepID=UPI00262B8F87|nr:hypothetical protein [uncultured Ruegeria sp.]
MKRPQTYHRVLAFALLAFYASAAPAYAGWLEDALGDFIRETLADLQILGVIIATIGFIAGLLSYIFGWGSLKIPIAAIVIGVLITIADTVVGG